jgi:hypothetical protein
MGDIQHRHIMLFLKLFQDLNDRRLDCDVECRWSARLRINSFGLHSSAMAIMTRCRMPLKAHTDIAASAARARGC